MWLVYLRFEDQGQVQTYHVAAENKTAVDQVYRLAEQHGLSKTARLVEYAFIYSSGTIKPKQAPNFHYYAKHEFIDRWQKAEGNSIGG